MKSFQVYLHLDFLKVHVKITLKENNMSRKPKHNKTIGEDQRAKLKAVEDGCLFFNVSLLASRDYKDKLN